MSPQVTDEGAGQQHFALNTPHPALRATCSPFCRYTTFSPGAGEICPQGGKALAPGQASKIDFPERETASSRLLSSHFVRQPPQRGRRHGIRPDGKSFCIYAGFLSPQCIIVINSVSNRQIFCTSIDFSICTIYTKSVHRLFDESHRSGGPETI